MGTEKFDARFCTAVLTSSIMRTPDSVSGVLFSEVVKVGNRRLREKRILLYVFQEPDFGVTELHRRARRGAQFRGGDSLFTRSVSPSQKQGRSLPVLKTSKP